MIISVPFGIGTVVFSPRKLLVTRLVSSAANFGTPVTCSKSRLLLVSTQDWKEGKGERTGGNIRNVSLKTLGKENFVKANADYC